eukprot:70853-Chlamydomonas_euryale.AAC.3
MGCPNMATNTSLSATQAFTLVLATSRLSHLCWPHPRSPTGVGHTQSLTLVLATHLTREPPHSARSQAPPPLSSPSFPPPVPLLHTVHKRHTFHVRLLTGRACRAHGGRASAQHPRIRGACTLNVGGGPWLQGV